MAFGFTYTLPTITGTHTDFPVILKTADFPATSIDGSGDAIDNGGGNLRAYTDSAKGTQLSVEVVTFVSSGSADAEVYVKRSAATSNTIYIEADDVETAQPANGASFGRDSVWTNYEAVYHFKSGSGYDDATGNGHEGSTGGTFVAGNIGGAIRLNGTSDVVDCGTDTALRFATDFSFMAYTKLDTVSGNRAPWANSASISVGGLELVNHGNKLSAAWNDGGIKGYYDSTQSLVTGTWELHHIIRDASAGEVEFFFDGGTPDTVSTATANIIYSPSFDHAEIGFQANNGYFDGDISEMRLSPTKFSNDYVDTEYENISAASAWGTVGTWADASGGWGHKFNGVSDPAKVNGVAGFTKINGV